MTHATAALIQLKMLELRAIHPIVVGITDYPQIPDDLARSEDAALGEAARYARHNDGGGHRCAPAQNSGSQAPRQTNGLRVHTPHLTSTGACSFSGTSSTQENNTGGSRMDAEDAASSMPASAEAGAQVPEPMEFCRCTRLHGNPLGCECLTDRPSGLCQWCEENGSTDGTRCNCLCRACNDVDIGADNDD